jgi:hypothetical protein
MKLCNSKSKKEEKRNFINILRIVNYVGLCVCVLVCFLLAIKFDSNNNILLRENRFFSIDKKIEKNILSTKNNDLLCHFLIFVCVYFDFYKL